MEIRLLQAIHAHASPTADVLFLFSNDIGTIQFFVALLLGVTAWQLRRGERRAAWLWPVLGISTFAIQELGKRWVARPRPALWPHLVDATSYSFPSGHALASASLWPVLAWIVSRRASPARRQAALALSVVVAWFVGVGRLYLGVHWPTDVLVGWALGAVQALVAIRWLGPSRRDTQHRA